MDMTEAAVQESHVSMPRLLHYTIVIEWRDKQDINIIEVYLLLLSI